MSLIKTEVKKSADTVPCKGTSRANNIETDFPNNFLVVGDHMKCKNKLINIYSLSTAPPGPTCWKETL
jgi:hypothetical protein